MKCQRCNRGIDVDFNYTRMTKTKGKEHILLCGICCANLLVICLQTDRLTFEEVNDFAQGHSEKLQEIKRA